MPKIAAAVLAFLCLALFSIPMSAQLLPHGNVYLGASYTGSKDVINKFDGKGWNASFEAIPFVRYRHLGIVLDGSGFYARGITEYNALLGPRWGWSYGKWRPFVQVMAGGQRLTSSGVSHDPLALDGGGGVDYKLFFKNFSWRVQGDYVRTHLFSVQQNEWRASTGLVWRF